MPATAQKSYGDFKMRLYHVPQISQGRPIEQITKQASGRSGGAGGLGFEPGVCANGSDPLASLGARYMFVE